MSAGRRFHTVGAEYALSVGAVSSGGAAKCV